MKSPENIDYKIISLLTAEQAHRFRVIPFEARNGTLSCFIPIGTNDKPAELEFITGKKIEWLEIPENELSKHLSLYYPFGTEENTRRREEIREDSDVIRFVRKIMDEAVRMNASDIHVERYESHARIRFRWEGQMVEKYEVPVTQYNAIISRIKILSELDISERRLPQDGRICMESGDKKIDIRVSTVPARFGEKAVLRLLTRNPVFLQLGNLGMQNDERERMDTALQQPNGIILITGPTGSGKTTTLYAALSQLNKPNRNLLTVEDPVEYNLEGINQVQVKEEIGLTFGNVLRAYLRQDPDIIMVGEIRDKETAEIAIRAALTGHLVLSTLHTNHSWDAVTRLCDMGIEPYLLSSSLRLLAAQRLIRILCPQCKTQSHEGIPDAIRNRHAIETHFRPRGCPECHYTGYARRQAVYEVIPIDNQLSGCVREREADISGYLKERSISTLSEHILQLIREGKTSLEEGGSYLL